MRVIARQLRDKTCLAAIFVSRRQEVSSGPQGNEFWGVLDLPEGPEISEDNISTN